MGNRLRLWWTLVAKRNTLANGEVLIRCVHGDEVSYPTAEVYLEVENEASSVAGVRLSQLRCSRDGREWNSLLPSRILIAAGSL